MCLDLKSSKIINIFGFNYCSERKMTAIQNSLTVAFWCLVACTIVGAGPFSWMEKDNFDAIVDRMTAVNAGNCHSKPRSELELPMESVSQVPVYHKLFSNVFFANRSMLLHMHNLALQRAFYYSFTLQRLNKSRDFINQPGLMYLYMSSAADVSASPGWINGSSLLFDNNCAYANWYLNINYNRTLPLFGVRASRANDFHESADLLQESTNNAVNIEDYATGPDFNYTDQSYKYAPYTRYETTGSRHEKPQFWWPDNQGYKDSLRKYTYSVGIKVSNQTGKFVKDEYEEIKFYGPPQPNESDLDVTLPVLFTKPYFDCGRSNKWITTMTAPVVDYMLRYSIYIHLRRPRFVAVVGIDGDFESIDINQCPLSEGNAEPNMFAGTHRCRDTTMCEPISGFGFHRGGYQCVCLPGYHYPPWQDGPFQGSEIERATQKEYEADFDCLKTEDWKTVHITLDSASKRKRSTDNLANIQDEFMYIVKRRSAADEEINIASAYQQKFVQRYSEETKLVREKREAFEEENWRKMQDIRFKFYNIRRENCRLSEANELYMPDDAGYGVEKQFEAQGRTALRLAHFLSNFLQNVDGNETFGYIKGDRRLSETQLFGEVLAMVMGDFKVLGAGIYFDHYKFKESPANYYLPFNPNSTTREYFGPLAWRIQNPGDGLDLFRALDSAGLEKPYTDELWFKRMKQRWTTNFHALKEYIDKPMIRSSPFSNDSKRFDRYPITYRAPSYEDGEWRRPEFRCDERIDDWVATYSVPFFGQNSLKSEIEFQGIVIIDVKLWYLDINQCPTESHVPNAFKNTAKCDFTSQYCVPFPGKGFGEGAYKCECRQGYQYPFEDQSWFFHGQTLEEEYYKKIRGMPNRYDTLKCTKTGAGTSTTVASVALITFTIVLLFLQSD
ncbi:hypothetical protein ACF0H5_017983 [Mactra antiquata]